MTYYRAALDRATLKMKSPVDTRRRLAIVSCILLLSFVILRNL